MSNEPHVADAEKLFMAISVTPDFCMVEGNIVPFDIVAPLPPEHSNYASTVLARSEKVLTQGSLVAGVLGNAGLGVQSEVSLAGGHVKVLEGASRVFAESRPVARHGDLCEINGAIK